MLSLDVRMMIPRIQAYLGGQPVEKAWLFGSCSRGEETRDSDVDILVRYKDGESLSLFAIAKMACALRKLLNRKVDLVEEGRLLSFAGEDVEHDKILIFNGETR